MRSSLCRTTARPGQGDNLRVGRHTRKRCSQLRVCLAGFCDLRSFTCLLYLKPRAVELALLGAGGVWSGGYRA